MPIVSAGRELAREARRSDLDDGTRLMAQGVTRCHLLLPVTRATYFCRSPRRDQVHHTYDTHSRSFERFLPFRMIRVIPHIHTIMRDRIFGNEDENAERRHFSFRVCNYLLTSIVVEAFAVQNKLRAWPAASSTCCLNRRRLVRLRTSQYGMNTYK